MRRIGGVVAGMAGCAMAAGAAFAAPACAADAAGRPSADQAALIQEVINRSSLHAQLARVPEQMRAQLEARKEEMKEPVYWRVQEAMATAFSVERLSASVTDSFARHGNPERLQQAIEWLKSPLALRMVGMEEAAASPDAEEALRAYINQLGSQPPAPERVALARRISAATGAPGTAMKLMSAMVEGMARALDAAEGGGIASQDEAKRAIAQLEGQRQMIEQGILIKLLFTYRDATDQELTDLAAFWESELGAWLNQATVDAFVAALGDSSEEMARQLAPLINANP